MKQVYFHPHTIRQTKSIGSILRWLIEYGIFPSFTPFQQYAVECKFMAANEKQLQLKLLHPQPGRVPEGLNDATWFCMTGMPW